jgi:hypothetical protein
MKKETVQTIDLTPTWQEILPTLLNGSQRGIESCNVELMRMAKLADKYIESLKQDTL